MYTHFLNVNNVLHKVCLNTASLFATRNVLHRILENGILKKGRQQW